MAEPMDEVIAEFAAKLQKIYDERTAGDHTFAGVLVEFSRVSDGVKFQEFVKQYVDEAKTWKSQYGRPRLCRCGYPATNLADLDEHVAAASRIDDGKHHG